MTNWYEKLKNNLLKAIEDDAQGRALNAVIAAYDCYHRNQMYKSQYMEILNIYNAWEASWAEE